MKSKLVFTASSIITVAFFTLMGCGRGGVGTGPRSSDLNEGIVNGKSVKSTSEDRAASVVALVLQEERGQALCSGTLIDTSTVLTAAHCVDNSPEKLVIVFGDHVQSSKPDHQREAQSFIQNPRWQQDGPEGHGDLALIHFEGGLPEGYHPVDLAPKNVALSNGTEVEFLGYGVTNGLSHAGPGALRETTSHIIGEASPTEIVSDGRESSVCFGDSGGPAFVKTDGKFEQWGVASSVSNQACNEASIHTRLGPYLGWIKSATARLNRDKKNQKNETAPGSKHRRKNKNFPTMENLLETQPEAFSE
jgi:hypothetical protein